MCSVKVECSMFVHVKLLLIQPMVTAALLLEANTAKLAKNPPR